MDSGFTYYGRDMQDSVSRLQKKYWSTKQILIKKLGRKEDDSLIASDAELDAKLELFAAIYHSCVALERILENYQDRLSILSQEENAMGRFLKECGKQDKTRAGKMMTATGKSLAFTAQQRLTLRNPLVRLYQEVETYLNRAIADTEETVNKMEKSRTDYRGALLWMKEVSEKLDPDTYRQLEKYRKVQGHVKKTKMSFEKLKVDTLQKVDLLSASRCNMFSHALAAYQQALLAFWEKTAQALADVSDSFKGYQHYEFTVVKELAEPSRKLANEAGNMTEPDSPSKKALAEGDKDRAMFYKPDFKDSPEHSAAKAGDITGQESLVEDRAEPVKEKPSCFLDDDEPLLSLGTDSEKLQVDFDSMLDDLFSPTSSHNAPLGSFAKEWENTFGSQMNAESNKLAELTGEPDLLGGAFQDINLLDEFGNGDRGGTAMSSKEEKIILPSELLNQQLSSLNSFGGIEEASKPTLTPTPSSPNVFSMFQDKAGKTKSSDKQDTSAWLGLFADLDPIANPDAIGAKGPQEERNC